ncbi:DUF7009 family protein [Spongiimicrobium salis]|uniref:DUF7009 family protein n=1 Tax=Spongiimicrobium salis TaxID=1667022 RepID=UPI00374CC73B
MKIRIKGNSVRFRLTKTEVETFCKEGFYAESTTFANNTLVYCLKAKAGIEELEANFLNNRITIYMPQEALSTWANSNLIGYRNAVDWNDTSTLSLLVEKDFSCLDNTVEDQSDNYPNPKLS